jgi:hypothetical protein
LRGRTEGTIRKQISKIYEDFGIKSEFPGDQSQRDKLKALFRKHKPELVSDCPSAVTNEVSNEQEHLNQDDTPHLSSTRAVEGDENLMSLATRLLQKLGFDQKFKVTKVSGYIGYRFKNPEEVTYPYRLILSQQQEGLCISIPQYILEPYLLTLKYWTTYCTTEEEGNIEEAIAGRFLVLPLKKDIFLDSLHPNYWNILEVERKTIGSFYLNEIVNIYNEDDEYFVDYYASDSISLKEFNPNTLSDSNSYLLVGEDRLFSYTWQICISSSEILQEFIGYFGGKILVPDEDDGIPF